MSRGSWLAVLAACCALGGCPKSNAVAADGPRPNTKDGPQDQGKVNPGTPGFDPPDTTPDGSNTGHGGTTGQPSSMNAGSAAEMMPPVMNTAGSMAMEPGAAGSGGGLSAPEDAGTAMADGGTFCSNAQACDATTPCTDPSLHCIVVPSCMGPVCTSPEDACQLECESPTCALLESYPEQIRCD